MAEASRPQDTTAGSYRQGSTPGRDRVGGDRRSALQNPAGPATAHSHGIEAQEMAVISPTARQAFRLCQVGGWAGR